MWNRQYGKVWQEMEELVLDQRKTFFFKQIGGFLRVACTYSISFHLCPWAQAGDFSSCPWKRCTIIASNPVNGKKFPACFVFCLIFIPHCLNEVSTRVGGDRRRSTHACSYQRLFLVKPLHQTIPETCGSVFCDFGSIFQLEPSSMSLALSLSTWTCVPLPPPASMYLAYRYSLSLYGDSHCHRQIILKQLTCNM